MKVPDIFKHEQVTDFLQDFFSVNQPLSHRQFANILNWPTSLLNDLLANRRGLSVARAVEFGQRFEMTAPEIERLIYLSFRDSDSPPLSSFVESYLRSDGRELPIPSQEDPVSTHPHFISGELFCDFAAMSLHCFLTWKGGKVSEKDIVESLGRITGLSTEDEVRKAIHTLREAGIISGDAPHFIVEKKHLAHRGPKEGFSLICEALRDLRRRSLGSERWGSGHIVFPKNKMPELLQRLDRLRNWITACEEQIEKMDEEQFEQLSVPLHAAFFISPLAPVDWTQAPPIQPGINEEPKS